MEQPAEPPPERAMELPPELPFDPVAALTSLMDELRRIGHASFGAPRTLETARMRLHLIAIRSEAALMHVRNLLRHHDARRYRPWSEPRSESTSSDRRGG